MLAQIRDSSLAGALLTGVAVLFLASCATKEAPLINDPTARRGETALPWNEQESWEQSGQMGAMAERLEGRR